MPKPGDVYFDSDFEFTDGEIGQKIIIVLNAPINSEPYLFVRTTSDKRRLYINLPKGCHKNKLLFFVHDSYKEEFKTKTYIQFH